MPIVPIVIRNAGDLMRRGEAALRPGTVDVAVLAPIPTTRWKAADIDRHVASVRQRFQDTLDNWPDAGREPAQATATVRKRPSQTKPPTGRSKEK